VFVFFSSLVGTSLSLSFSEKYLPLSTFLFFFPHRINR
jgi:hypothetical protein